MDIEKFKSLDYGTKPSTSKYEVVDVDINPDVVIKSWADAYAADMLRRNPLKFNNSNVIIDDKEVKLDGNLLYKYFCGLLQIRVDYVNDECKVWRQAKRLMMPAWIQFVISEIGVAYDRGRGLKFVPHMKLDNKLRLDIATMLLISSVLASFVEDGKPFFDDAFPRKIDGDIEMMSQALIENFITGNDIHTPPVISYITGFLGISLQKEEMFKMLYRVVYDDVQLVRSMLISDPKVLE